MVGEVPVHQRPAQFVLAGHRRDRAAVGDLTGCGPAQPAGHPRSGRDLGGGFGEGLTWALCLLAGELPFVPAQVEGFLAVGQIPWPGGTTLADCGGDDPALGAGRPLLRAFDMHQPSRFGP